MVCGVYCAPNLSPGGLQASRSVFAVLSGCMETFVFVYIGVTLFMEPQQWHCVKFTVGDMVQYVKFTVSGGCMEPFVFVYISVMSSA